MTKQTEKPLKRKRRQLISGSFIYDEEEVAHAVERLKEDCITSGIYNDDIEKRFLLAINEIFGDLK